MWKELADFAQKLLALIRRVQQLEDDNRAIRQELKDARTEMPRHIAPGEQLVLGF